MALLAAVIGALVTFGAVLYGKHLEQDQWIRERRLQAYADFLGALDGMVTGGLGVSTPDDVRELLTICGMVSVLGPRPVGQAANLASQAVADLVSGVEPGRSATSAARAQFVGEAHRAIHG